jgi:hypothetical protein
MTRVLAVIALVGFMAAWCMAVVAWFSAIVFAVKAVRRTQAGVRLWVEKRYGIRQTPFSIPSLLTTEGLAYRRKCFIAIGVFVVCVGVPLLVAAVTGALK